MRRVGLANMVLSKEGGDGSEGRCDCQKNEWWGRRSIGWRMRLEVREPAEEECVCITEVFLCRDEGFEVLRKVI
jgi:hypothetical protein